MSHKIVRRVDAFVGETVRITWRKRASWDPTCDPADRYQTLTEDYTAPPDDVWKARQKGPDEGTGTDSGTPETPPER